MQKRYPTFFVALALAFGSVAIATPSSADVLAQSNFDIDRDGWLVKDLLFPNPGAPPAPASTFTPVYNGAGGNPGGHLSFPDPSANAWYWYAPAKFLGNKQNAYGGKLSFDLAVSGTGTPFNEEDIILVGGGLTLVFALPAPPVPTFTSYHIGLTEAGWKRNNNAGAPATRADMITVLSALTDIYIRGEYRLALDDVGRLDNVVLEGSAAVCDIQMSQTAYVNGEQVIAEVFRIANVAATPTAVEVKLWIDVPSHAPIKFANVGADGSFVLPAGLNKDLGPFSLFTVPPTAARGIYAFSCRMLHPITGALLMEDLNPFEIQ